MAWDDFNEVSREPDPGKLSAEQEQEIAGMVKRAFGTPDVRVLPKETVAMNVDMKIVPPEIPDDVVITTNPPKTGHDVFRPWPEPTQALKDLFQEFGSKKETNPKDAVGVRKVPFSVIPSGVVAELGLALLEGARKYGRHNYRVAGIRYSVYYDAAMRHLTSWWEGEDIDPDSGLSHITKAIATLTVLRDAMMIGKYSDDRPPATLPPVWLAELNQKAGEIIDRYPDAKPPHTGKPL